MSPLKVEDLRRDVEDIKRLLLDKGGGGAGRGWIQDGNGGSGGGVVFLAPDERDILNLLCQGLTNKEIAQKAFVSTRRVEQILTGMYRKAQVKNRTELVRWAITSGQVSL
jgi:DNA-binding CsgD family transcriptional regulator